MAYIGTDSDVNQKSWRPGLVHEAERQAQSMGFVTTDEDSGVVLLEDLTRKRGDKIQVRFSPTVDDFDGFDDAAQIEGNEEELDFVSDELLINYLGLAYRQAGVMSQQRVNFDLKKAAFIKLSTRWARRWEQWFFNQLCGYTPAMGAGQDNYKRTGMNPVTQYDANHIWRPTGIAADEDLTSGNSTPSLDIVNAVVASMSSKSTITYPITPCPDGYYHMFLHTFQWKLLRENTNSGDWGDLQKAVLQGGQDYNSSAFARGFLGVYANVKLHVSDYVPLGVDSGDATASVANVRRAVIIGSRAAHMAFGEGYANGDHLDWSEQVRSHKVWSVLADTVGGFKRTIFNNETYGAYLVPMYSEN